MSTNTTDTDGVPMPEVAIWGTLGLYATAWALLMWPQGLPLGRPGVAMVFAALVYELRQASVWIWPSEGYEALHSLKKIEPTPIRLLFGLMMVNSYIEYTGMWLSVKQWLDADSPRLFLVKVCVVSVVLSALLLNDTICFVMPPLVLDICARRQARSSLPFLIAVSSSANLGSALTIIGNPQNALVASLCPQITFLSFMRTMSLPVVVGLMLNTAVLLLWFRHHLVFESSAVAVRQTCVEEVRLLRSRGRKRWHTYLATTGVVIGAMLACWLQGLAFDDVAMAAGCTLMLAMAVYRKASPYADQGGTETDFSLEAIEYPLLILCAGQFVLVGGSVDTGMPQALFEALLSGDSSGDVILGSLWNLLRFAGLVLVLSNLISNVPVILMLQPLFKALPAASAAPLWAVVAGSVTAAGNVTILGSAANLIVANEAEKRGENSFTALNHGKASFTPALFITGLGILFLPPLAPRWTMFVIPPVAFLLLLCAFFSTPEVADFDPDMGFDSEEDSRALALSPTVSSSSSPSVKSGSAG